MGLKLSSRSWQGWSSDPEADRIEAPQSDGVKAHQKLMGLKFHSLMVLKLSSTSWLILLKFHNLKVWSLAPQADHGVEAPQAAPNSDQVAKKRIYISFLERFALLIASLGCPQCNSQCSRTFVLLVLSSITPYWKVSISRIDRTAWRINHYVDKKTSIAHSEVSEWVSEWVFSKKQSLKAFNYQVLLIIMVTRACTSSFKGT